jgi:hypothetical protein
MTTVEYDRELLAAIARRHLGALPVRTSTAISAAVDELTDPLNPPALLAVAESDIGQPAAVLSAVRDRLLTAAQDAPTAASALARARAARELGAALDALRSVRT